LALWSWRNWWRAALRSSLSRHPITARVPKGVTAVRGDGTDVDAMRKAMDGAQVLFLLIPVVPDELARALVMLDIASAARFGHVVYFSMKQADTFADVAHAASKFASEAAIRKYGIAATILRPNYFFQNDASLKTPVMDEGVYPTPIGNVGVSMNDARDIAEVAALVLTGEPPSAGDVVTIEIGGPDVMTGDSIARLWSEVVDRPVKYLGDDLAVFEKRAASMASSWTAHDTALMFRGFQREGMNASAGVVDRLTAMLGRPLRTYRGFAQEIAATWNESLLDRIRVAASKIGS
jgi:uncharacterized protein YbjT (DUF2867 family)